MVSVEGIGQTGLELLEYVALAVITGFDEFDVGQGRVDDGHGFWDCWFYVLLVDEFSSKF